MSLESSLHREADRYEPRLRRAYVRAVEKMRRKVSLVKLAEAIQGGKIEQAMSAAGLDSVEATLDPLSGILRDAFERGGRATARVVE